MRVDHIAVVVADLDEAIPRWQALTGGSVADRQVADQRDVEVVFITLGDTQIELISPLDPENGVARYLTKRGESVHHVALQVDNIVNEMERLRSHGVQLIDERPRPGSHGSIAFVHPRSTGGTLIELVQHGEANHEREPDEGPRQQPPPRSPRSAS